MVSRNITILSAAGAAMLLTAGGVGAAQLDKSVTLSVDGQTRSAHVFGSTVGDLLESEGINLQPGDVVVPAADAALSDGDTIAVKYSRPLTVTVDGHVREARTTETTVDAALTALGVRDDGARLSVSRSQSIGRQGLELTVTTPKTVRVVVGGKSQSHTLIAANVGEALQQLRVPVDSNDKVSPARSAGLEDGMTITVSKVTSKTETSTRAVAHDTIRKSTSDLYSGETKVSRKGVDGTKTVTVRKTIVDGKVTKTETVSTKVTKQPVDEIVLVGTKQRATSSGTSSSGSTSSGSTSGAGINLANSGMWDSIAQCESGGNWSINTGNGYYGGLQFSYQTWLAYDGDDFAQRADLASRAEQITVANRVYADVGLSAWGCAP